LTATLEQRAHVLADALQEQGYLTEVTKTRTGDKMVYAALMAPAVVGGPTERLYVRVSQPEDPRRAIASIVVTASGLGADYEWIPGTVERMLKRAGLKGVTKRLFHSRYVHKISSSDKDVGPDVALDARALADRTSLAAVLRDQRILSKGETVSDYRIGADGKVVVFPKGRIMPWHSIILTPAALSTSFR
jgi:hypothetical protein